MFARAEQVKVPPGAIWIRHLVLDYPLYRHTLIDRFRVFLGQFTPALRPPVRRVLNKISLSIEPGEAVGILGVNGAGKTSLLKVLSGLVSPTEGTVHVGGCVMALLAMGLGFRPSFTGRENLLHSALLLGLKTEDIEKLILEVTEFSELGEALNQPYHTYSSELRARLAFSLATSFPADIVILDETLARDDARFVAKCNQRLLDLRDSGRTVLFVSHNLGEVVRLTSRVVVLDHGSLKFDGDVFQGLTVYEHMLADRIRSVEAGPPDLQDIDISVGVRDEGGRPVTAVELGQRVAITLTISSKKEQGELCVCLKLMLPNNQLYASLMTRRWWALREVPEYQDSVYIGAGDTTITWTLPHWTCGEGTYFIDVYIGPVCAPDSLDARRGRCWVHAARVNSVYGNVFLKSTFSLTELQVEDVTIRTPSSTEAMHAVGSVSVRKVEPLMRQVGVAGMRPSSPGSPRDTSPHHAGRFEDMGGLTEVKIQAILAAVQPYTMVHESGVLFAMEKANELIIRGIPGVIVECGVWRGGCSIAMLLAQRERFGRVERPVYLLDSFEGLPPPAPVDGPLAKLWQQGGNPETYFDNCRADVEAVQATLDKMGFGGDDYTLRKGWFGSAVPALADLLGNRNIALLRLDCDWYDSIMVCLEHLLPLVPEEGAVIMDDYYAWDGCAKALHDYLSRNELPYRIKSLHNCYGAYFIKKASRARFDEI